MYREPVVPCKGQHLSLTMTNFCTLKLINETKNDDSFNNHDLKPQKGDNLVKKYDPKIILIKLFRPSSI